MLFVVYESNPVLNYNIRATCWVNIRRYPIPNLNLIYNDLKLLSKKGTSCNSISDEALPTFCPIEPVLKNLLLKIFSALYQSRN